MHQPNAAKRSSAMRTMALALCAVVVAVILIAPVYIATHANHAHDANAPGGGCATCAHIKSAGNLLKSISAAIIGAALVWRAFFAILSATKPADGREERRTPVGLKVRMNN